MPELSKLCIHSITTQPLPIEELVAYCAEHGIGGITVWENLHREYSAKQLAARLRAAHVAATSVCRGGFFAAPTEGARNAAIETTKALIRYAAELESPLLVIVPGAHPEIPLSIARDQIQAALAELLPLAEKMNIRLGIEPLHPMYADSRSAINTMAAANEMCETFRHERLGIVVDVYHVWWDAQLEDEIAHAGNKKRLFAYHISDWKTPTTDILNDREMMGKGCIPLKQIQSWMRMAGFDGFSEVEIFSENYWAQDQTLYLDQIVEAYQTFG